METGNFSFEIPVSYLLVGIIMFYIWPTVQAGINGVGEVVRISGYFGTWVYGFMERLLIPFGLHHVFYLPFWQTSVGGTMEVGGKMIEGAQNIFFAQLADPSTTHFSVEATRFMSGKFPLMIFGLPGAALAMYKTAKPEKKKIVGGLLFSAALTSILTGITEPLEFTFLFVAPFLYLIHCIFAGLAYMLMHILQVGVGMTFSGGLIDLTLFGILPGNGRTNWLMIPLVGIGYFIVYYFLFSFLIKKFNLKTPGREDDDNAEVKLYTKADVNAKKGEVQSGDKSANSDDDLSMAIVHGLGGKSNIESVDCCITRLRCTVADSNLVRDDVLKATGAAGVVKAGAGVQVIYGPRVTLIKSNLEEYLERSNIDDAYGDMLAAGQIDGAAKLEEENKVDLGESSMEILSPANGDLLDLSEVPDDVFSQKLMGEGFAVESADGDIYAPVSGEIGMIFPTKHAIIIATEDGIEVLIHMGIDTVKMDGRGFELFCEMGQKVKAGDKLAHMDKAVFQAEGYPTVTPVIFTNLDASKKIDIVEGQVKAGDKDRIVCK